MNNILCLILARKNSKRLPNKNKLILGSKPLIQWTIDHAKQIFSNDRILLSTDDEDIFNLGKKNEIIVPWLRPSGLALDETSSFDSGSHAINWYLEKFGAVDSVMLLQPTSPFRKIEDIREGVKIYERNFNKAVVGVSPFLKKLNLIYYRADNKLLPLVDNDNTLCEHNKVFNINGCFYLISIKELKLQKTFTPPNFIPLIINSATSAIDIDTKEDYEYANFIAKNISLL